MCSKKSLVVVLISVFLPAQYSLHAADRAVVSGGDQGPAVAVPWSESDMPVGQPSEESDSDGSVAGVGPGMQSAADHIIGLQCPSGGWQWPHGGSCSGLPTNIAAPVGMGLLRAYSVTGDPAHLAAAVDAGDFNVLTQFSDTDPAFASFDPAFQYRLSVASGDTSYSLHAAVGFFDELTAGTYGDPTAGSWTAYYPADTYDYLNRHKANRSGSSINIRSWDMQYMPWVAGAIGNGDSAPADGITQQQTFLNAVLDGLNTLDRTAPASVYYDILGLAGSVHGLALNGTTSFPAIVSPNFTPINGITTLCALADVLAGYQNADGSWNWHSNLAAPDVTDESTQETAFGVMALEAAAANGCGPYTAAIAIGRDWLRSMQLPNGGFLDYPTATSSNIEVEGESLSAMALDGCTVDVLEFTLAAGSDCVKPGETVTVELHQRGLDQLVRGFQAFAQFDDTAMTFGSGSYTASPYGLAVITPIIAVGTEIDMAAGINDLGGQTPTSADATLVTLTFTAGAMQGPTVVSFRAHDPPNRFSDEFAGEVLPCLIESPTIVIDGTNPVITCPSNVTIECTASTLPSNTGSAMATDNLDPSPDITYTDSVAGGACPQESVITRTWKATDCAGNFSTCPQTINVVDTTAPTITTPASNMTVECDGSGNTAQLTAWLASNGSAVAADNCGAVSWSNNFTTLSNLCGETGSAMVTFTATDDCDNFSTTTATFIIEDITDPVIAACPSNITVPADAGTCGAVVTYTPPSAADNCDASPSVVCTLPSGSTFTGGPNTVTCTATDDCENSSSPGGVSVCTFTVTVEAVNEMDVTVQLSPTMAAGPFSRCITFEFRNCPSTTLLNTSTHLMSFNGGTTGLVTIDVPCGNYDCATARDRQHTLRRTDESFGISGTKYVADFTLSPPGGDWLIGGNLNGDTWIDILDFGGFSSQYFTSPGAIASCPGTPALHADINGDGPVNNLDFTFIRTNFLLGNEDNCCGAGSVASEGEAPVERISIRELNRLGLSDLAAGDLNRDGWLDVEDIEAFARGVRPEPGQAPPTLGAIKRATERDMSPR